MKKIYFALVMALTSVLVFGQSPQSFKYQSVVRNSSGTLITNQAVAFRISILQGSAIGTAVYTETHNLSTNAYGLAELSIGLGTLVSGSFSGINWGNGPYFLKVELDPAGTSSYLFMGTTQLLSVPYALYAEKTGQAYTAGAGIDISGNTITNTAPDQSVSITAGPGISTSGAYPNFTISNTDPDRTVTLTGTGGTGISGTYPDFTINTKLYKPGTGLFLSNDSFHTYWQKGVNNNLFNTNSGFVGIGTTAPAFKLHVYDTSTAIYAVNKTNRKGTHTIYSINQTSFFGTANTLTASIAAIAGYAVYGNPYHYGVLGARWDDGQGNSAGVMGLVDYTNGNKAWGALGFQDDNLKEYGGYFNGKLYTNDTAHADGFKFTTAKTHYYTVPAESFIPASSIYAYTNSMSMGGAYLDPAVGAGAMVAGVNLPHGAIVKSVKAYYYDASTSDLIIQLDRRSMVGGAFSTMTDVTSSGTPGYANLTDNTVTYSVIDNLNYSYLIYVYCTDWTGSTLKIEGITITYTTVEAD